MFSSLLPWPLLAVLLLAVFTHGWNLFHYPYYEGDEGIYVSQAWSTLTQGKLSPYVYWYDHPPLGWITMAGWSALFGGNFFVFGESSIDHMRVFMLLVHVVSAALVYYIARRLGARTAVAACAVIIFTLSPLFVYYQRRVLLDNLVTLWVLCSFALLLKSGRSWRTVFLSGAVLGVGVLTKLPALVFAPLFLYVASGGQWLLDSFQDLSKRARVQQGVLWLSGLFFVLFLFVGYTFSQGEFLPESVTGNGKSSFLDGVQFQLDRDSTHSLLHPQSSFRIALSDWLRKDTFTVVLGAVSIIFGLFFAIKDRSLRIVLCGVLIFVAFMMRGGIVTNFHILPVVPFVALLVVLVVEKITSLFAKNTTRHNVIFWLVIGCIIVATIETSEKGYLTRDETSNHNASVRYIKENLDNDASVMMDVQGLVDLWDPRQINEKTFPRADWFSKIIHDNYIQDFKYEGQWQNIEYTLLSHELLRQMQNVPEGTLAKDAFTAGLLDREWLDGADHVDIDAFQSSFGNWAALYKTQVTQ